MIYRKEVDCDTAVWLLYPSEERHTPYKRSALTLLIEDTSEEAVRRLLEEEGLADFARQNDVILAIPLAPAEGWQPTAAHLDRLARIHGSISRPDNEPVKFNSQGIPLLESMLSEYHPMNDVRYYAGVGTGATLALTLAACRPELTAAVLAVDGSLPEALPEEASGAPVPVMLLGRAAEARGYFDRANHAEPAGDGLDACPVNPSQMVLHDSRPAHLDTETIARAWETLFRRVRRTNTGARGDVEPRTCLESCGFEQVVDEILLPDGLKHTWFIHVPASVRDNPGEKAPLVMFFHGGSDNPEEAAEMSKLHELGEREGFITVYPWGTNRCGWNINLVENEEDDEAYTLQLIDYLIAHYPVDPGRVYLSGFSNGAGHALMMGMMHPDVIAAIFPIDSNWPGMRIGPSDISPEDVPAFRRAMEKKKEKDYRMPVWYTYGTREPSYPVYRGCSQQHQYDFYKWFNRIPVRETPPQCAPDPCGCGVPGDVQLHLAPSGRHPHHQYDVQRFFSEDDVPVNLYNYVIMRDKGHEVAQMDPELGWRYVRHFRREKDGSLTLIP